MNVVERMKSAEDQVLSETKWRNGPQFDDLLALAEILEEGLTDFEIVKPNPGRRVAHLLAGVAFRHCLTAFDLTLRGHYNACLNILRLVALQIMLADYYGVRPRKASAYIDGPRTDRLHKKLNRLLKTVTKRPSLRTKIQRVQKLIDEGQMHFAEQVIESNRRRFAGVSSATNAIVKSLLKELRRGDTPGFRRLERALKAEELDRLALQPLHLDVHARFFHVIEGVEIFGDKIDPSPRYSERWWRSCSVRILYYMWKIYALLAALIPDGVRAAEWKKAANDFHKHALDRFAEAIGLVSREA